MGGAKNHGIVLPDADLDQAVKDLAGAAYGSAGERCMALPVVVPVGQKTAEALRERCSPRSRRCGRRLHRHRRPLRPGGHRRPQAEDRDYIQLGVDEGAELVVDGRGFSCRATRRASSSARACSTT
jgi:malonate-semialdehyde dehydrogenase (acetylating)/methylmalonate-semialdehyde dehydrogenase